MALGTLGVVKHWSLVSARPQPTGSRHATLVVALSVLAGIAVVGRVLSADPIAYGVPVWPFANTAEQAENRVMTSVANAARLNAAKQGNLQEIPESVTATDVEVLRTQAQHDGLAVWLLLRLEVPAVGTRCREVVVSGATPVEVNSRHVDC